MDAIDREHLDQVAESRGLQLIHERMRSDALGKLRRLRSRDVNTEETQYLRGYLDALDTALSVPGILLAESKRDK